MREEMELEDDLEDDEEDEEIEDLDRVLPPESTSDEAFEEEPDELDEAVRRTGGRDAGARVSPVG